MLQPPVAGKFVQRRDQVGQGDAVVVQEAVGGEDGGEAVGQAGDSEGMDAGGQGVAHAQVLQDELAVAQLQPGFQRGCEECMPSFYAPTCDKTYASSPSPHPRAEPCPPGAWPTSCRPG